MRGMTLAAIGLIAAAACRDGPTAPATGEAASRTSNLQHSVVAQESLDRVRNELQGAFVQTIARSNIAASFADDLLRALPPGGGGTSADELASAEASLRTLAARVERVTPTQSGTTRAGVAPASAAEVEITRDVLRLILGDAVQTVALQRTRLRDTNAPQP